MAAASVAWAHEFVPIMEGRHVIGFLDQATIQQWPLMPNVNSAWLLLVYTPPVKKGEKQEKYDLEQLQFDCVSRQILSAYGIAYDASHAMLGDPYSVGTAAPVIPDTLGEKALERACSGHRDTSLNQFATVDAAISYADFSAHAQAKR